MLAFLASRVRADEREDIHQDTWQRAWQHLPDQFRGGSFRAWLYEITRNRLVDFGRRRHPANTAIPGGTADETIHRLIAALRQRAERSA